jgi:nucleotidyltransferase/DNA polymerase involved in DNA repair
MPASSWPRAFAHVDADCFFASCELLRHPDLRHAPLCVLSSQDACVVAKTYDAKAAGIKTGMPVWDAKKLLPRATYLSADFRYYGQISDGLFSILRRFSPVVEEYSIDEAFLDLQGLRELHPKTYRQLADEMRTTIRHELGVTVSVGISVTRTLAKMASEYNKPNGTTIVAGSRVRDFLQRVGVRDIPGVGCNREALLVESGIRSGADFAAAPERRIKQLLGKAGIELWQELNGEAIYAVEHEARLPQSVSRTASLGELTLDRETIHSNLVRHALRLSRELICKRLTARQLTVFVTLKSFGKCAETRELAYPTADYFELMKQAGEMLDALFDGRQIYRACGVIATGIVPREAALFDLFQQDELKREERHVQLLQTVHTINDRYGANSVSICGMAAGWGSRQGQRFFYPVIKCG